MNFKKLRRKQDQSRERKTPRQGKTGAEPRKKNPAACQRRRVRRMGSFLQQEQHVTQKRKVERLVHTGQASNTERTQEREQASLHQV